MCYTVIKSLLPVLNTFNFLFALFFSPLRKRGKEFCPLQLPCSSQTGHQQGLNFEFSQPHSIFDCLIEKQVVPYSCLTPEGIINLGLAGECTAGTAPFLSWRWGNGERTWERGVEKTRTCLSITPGSWVYGQGEEEEEEEEGLVGRCSQLSRFWQVGIWGWSLFPLFCSTSLRRWGLSPQPGLCWWKENLVLSQPGIMVC